MLRKTDTITMHVSGEKKRPFEAHIIIILFLDMGGHKCCQKFDIK